MRFLTTTLGRVLFAFPFTIFGLIHLLTGRQMATMISLPGALFWIYLSGALLLLCSLGLLSKVMGTWSAFGIAALMLVFILFVHIPGLTDPVYRPIHIQNILKNIALCGGALTWAGIFASRERRELVEPAPPVKPLYPVDRPTTAA